MHPGSASRPDDRRMRSANSNGDPASRPISAACIQARHSSLAGLASSEAPPGSMPVNARSRRAPCASSRVPAGPESVIAPDQSSCASSTRCRLSTADSPADARARCRPRPIMRLSSANDGETLLRASTAGRVSSGWRAAMVSDSGMEALLHSLLFDAGDLLEPLGHKSSLNGSFPLAEGRLGWG